VFLQRAVSFCTTPPRFALSTPRFQPDFVANPPSLSPLFFSPPFTLFYFVADLSVSFHPPANHSPFPIRTTSFFITIDLDPTSSISAK
jgi:hypothetical protein